MIKKYYLQIFLFTNFLKLRAVEYDLAPRLVLNAGTTYKNFKQELEKDFGLKEDNLQLEYLVINGPRRTKIYISSVQLDQADPISENILMALAEGSGSKLVCKSTIR